MSWCIAGPTRRSIRRSPRRPMRSRNPRYPLRPLEPLRQPTRLYLICALRRRTRLRCFGHRKTRRGRQAAPRSFRDIASRTSETDPRVPRFGRRSLPRRKPTSLSRSAPPSRKDTCTALGPAACRGRARYDSLAIALSTACSHPASLDSVVEMRLSVATIVAPLPTSPRSRGEEQSTSRRCALDPLNLAPFSSNDTDADPSPRDRGEAERGVNREARHPGRRSRRTCGGTTRPIARPGSRP